MPQPNRGDVWLTDLGFAAKTRPCLVIRVPPDAQDRALIALVPHTTSVRGTRFEVSIPKRFLQKGAFDPQGLVTVATPRLVRNLGILTVAELALVEQSARAWLGL